MKTTEQIASELSPHLEANNAAVGETNRRLVKIGDGLGNPQPDTLLTPRDVFYRSSLDQNDRGVAILHPKCPIPIEQIDGYYDVEVWLANIPGSSQPYIVDLADTGGQGDGGTSPTEGLINSAAFPDQSRLVIMRLRPSDSASMSVFVDVGPYRIGYEVGDGTMGFAASADTDISDSTNPVTFNPTASSLAPGEHRLVGVAFDGTTGQFFAIPGVARSADNTLPSSESRSEFVDADYEAIDFTGYFPVGYVYNYDGQTEVEEDDCLRHFDPRLVIKAMGSAGVIVNYPRRTAWFVDELIASATMTEDSTTNSGMHYGYAQYQSSGTVADGNTWTASAVLETGTYTLSILGIKEADAGKVDIYVGPDTGSLVLQGTQDWYNGSQQKNQVLFTSITVLTSGYNIIKLVINGKNVSSSNYYLVFTKVWITPSAD